jgi:hypothetical protein
MKRESGRMVQGNPRGVVQPSPVVYDRVFIRRPALSPSLLTRDPHRLQ